MIDISKWDRGDDPITLEQAEYVSSLLDHEVSDKALEGFLMVSPRFVDEFGSHRTPELETVFRTATPHGKDVLRESLEHARDWVGGMRRLESRYPVTIVPPRPASPMLKIVGIERLATHLFRVLHSASTIRATGERLRDHVTPLGRLPLAGRRQRSEPRGPRPGLSRSYTSCRAISAVILCGHVPQTH